MIRAVWGAWRAQRRYARWQAVHCTHCGQRRRDADLTACEGPHLTILAHPGQRDPHMWVQQRQRR